MTFDRSLKGRRVRLERCNDPYTKLEQGALGTISFTDDMGTLHVKWDSGSSLGLCRDDGDQWTLLPIDHATCSPEQHDRSLPTSLTPEELKPQIAEDGLLGCSDCGHPTFYCLATDEYLHVDPERSCFLHGAWETVTA